MSDILSNIMKPFLRSPQSLIQTVGAAYGVSHALI